MKEKLKQLVLQSIFLSEVEKEAWLKKIEDLGEVEIAGLFRIFERSQKQVQAELSIISKTDKDKVLLKRLKLHEKKCMTKLKTNTKLKDLN